MSWAKDFRQTWIAQRLADYGYIRRKDVMANFKVNVVTASTDFQRFLRERPGVMTYDRSTKRYIRAVQS